MTLPHPYPYPYPTPTLTPTLTPTPNPTPNPKLPHPKQADMAAASSATRTCCATPSARRRCARSPRAPRARGPLGPMVIAAYLLLATASVVLLYPAAPLLRQPNPNPHP